MVEIGIDKNDPLYQKVKQGYQKMSEKKPRVKENKNKSACALMFTVQESDAQCLAYFMHRTIALGIYYRYYWNSQQVEKTLHKSTKRKNKK